MCNFKREPNRKNIHILFYYMFSNNDLIKILLYTSTGYDAVRVTILWNRAYTFFGYYDLLCARKIQSLPSGGVVGIRVTVISARIV